MPNLQSDECPICSAPLKISIDTIDWGGPICEHYETCPNKCYAYEFVYGYTTVYVGDLQFGWGYSDDAEAIQAESDAIVIACDATRRAQLEDYWKLAHNSDTLQETLEAISSKLVSKAFPMTPHDEAEGCVTLSDIHDEFRAVIPSKRISQDEDKAGRP